MKRLVYLLPLLIGLELAVLLAPSVSAQGTLTIMPNQLTLAGTRCLSWLALGCAERDSRTILLETSQPITQAKLIALDLTRTDGVAVIPANAIGVSLPTPDLAANQPMTVSMTVDFRNAPSGDFKGNLFLTYLGGSREIPVTASVRDPWLVPLLVLLLGVILGVGVGAYRASGQDRDRVRVREGQLRTLMNADEALPASFRDRMSGYLAQVDIGLQGDQLQDAQTALANAAALWKKWLDNRADWLAKFDYHATLAKRCQANGDLARPIPYLESLCRAIDDAERTAPDLDNSAKFGELLDGLTDKINTYLQLQTQLDYLHNRAKQLLDAQIQKDWNDKIAEWQRRLDLQTADKPDDTLEGEIKQGQLDLEDVLERQPPPPGGVKGVVPRPRVDLLPGSPAVRQPPAVDQGVISAERRLWLFTLASYIIAIVLLAGIGFNELYINKPAFGASAWGDYFGLLAWGFGAEATRQAITGALKGWGLPGVPVERQD